jgi:hypothetical protein
MIPAMSRALASDSVETPNRRDEIDAIAGGKIAEGIMGGDHLAATLRDLRDGLAHLAIERVEFAR